VSAYRILVAIDLKAGTEHLLAEAQRYAKALEAIVDIVHVADPDPEFIGYRKTDPEIGTDVPLGSGNYDEILRESRAKEFRLERERTQTIAEQMRVSGIQVDRALTVQGPPLEAILEEVHKLGSDLLILGSHQHGAVYRLWYGDISVDAAKRPPCALLVVPIVTDAK
jgi:nucleotide-binding universal stress UspA family protein